MATLTQTLAPGLLDRAFRGSDGLWIKDQRFDLGLISLSASVAIVPILLFFVVQSLGLSAASSEDVVTIFVMILIGGPHVFTTYTRTYFERDFVARRPFWFYSSFLILLAVPVLALHSEYTQSLLMTGFFFAASIHILHQITYIVRCYNQRQDALLESNGARAVGAPGWHRWAEYALILVSLYPVANYKMVEGVFRIGRVDPKPFMPSFMMHEWFWILPTVVMMVALAAFVWKTRWEILNDRLHKPKFALICVTLLMGILIPLFPNLDSSFQGYNAWHSLQYLALTWYINVLRYDRGEISSSWVRSFSGSANRRKFYSAALGATFTLVAVVIGVTWMAKYAFPSAGLDMVKSYNAIAMSFLLVHYYHDAFFFSSHTVPGSPSGAAG